MTKTQDYFLSLESVAKKTIEAGCDMCSSYFTEIAGTRNLLTRVQKQVKRYNKDTEIDFKLGIINKQEQQKRIEIYNMMKKILKHRIEIL